MFLILPWKRKNIFEIWTWPQIFILNIFGFWAEEVSSRKRRQFLIFLRIFAITYTIFSELSILISIIIKLAAGNIIQNLFAIYTFVPTSVGAYKTIQIVRHRKSLRTAMQLIDELTNETRNSQDVTFLRSKMAKTWIVFSINFILFTSNVMHWLIRPLIDTFVHGQKSRILDTWPIFIDSWTQFFITYFSQVLSTLMFGINISTFYSIYFCMSECILCHFSILKQNFERLQLRGESKERSDLKRLIEYHIKLLRICAELKYATEGILIIETIATVSNCCCGVFIVTMSHDTKLMNVLDSELVLTTIFFITCWYSNEVTLQCQKLRTSIYLSEWLEGNCKQRKTFLFVMMRSMSPVIFGGFMKMNLNTFISVLKTAFSYYNFLVAVIITKKI